MKWKTIIRMRVQATRNWWGGYAWSPVKRCRQCKHTTPYHYVWCDPKKAR